MLKSPALERDYVNWHQFQLNRKWAGFYFPSILRTKKTLPDLNDKTRVMSFDDVLSRSCSQPFSF